MITDDIDKSDIVFLISVFILLNVFIDTVFQTLHQLANSQLKDEIKISDHRKYKEMFNSLQEGIIIIEGAFDPLLSFMDYSVLFSNEIAEIIFQNILSFTGSLNMLNASQEMELMQKKIFREYRSVHGAES